MVPEASNAIRYYSITHVFFAKKMCKNLQRNSFSFVTEFQNWTMMYHKRFEAATWKGNKLIGFSLGRPTYHGAGLRLDYIEKMPESSEPLLDITCVALLTYAGLLGATHVKIMKPINAEVRDYYVSKDFDYDAKQAACTRHILNI